MGLRKQLIKNNAILIINNNSIRSSWGRVHGKIEPNLNNPIDLSLNHYSECYFYKPRGTYSVFHEGVTYRCKSADYYYCNKYCLIINIGKKQEAFHEFLNFIRSSWNDVIGYSNNHIRDLKIEIEKQRSNIEVVNHFIAEFDKCNIPDYFNEISHIPLDLFTDEQEASNAYQKALKALNN
ncbi:hypothetical protein [Tenacibaculum piscium]|uniref:hypothetical protein n=1 Tax=Tenacibaculum piscium TaxID=1458515 RepID=UPI001F45269F|nr:hypothetical protein [Tenacibaculum piscium]